MINDHVAIGDGWWLVGNNQEQTREGDPAVTKQPWYWMIHHQLLKVRVVKAAVPGYDHPQINLLPTEVGTHMIPCYASNRSCFFGSLAKRHRWKPVRTLSGELTGRQTCSSFQTVRDFTNPTTCWTDGCFDEAIRATNCTIFKEAASKDR